MPLHIPLEHIIRMLRDLAVDELRIEGDVDRRINQLDSLDTLRLAGRVNSLFALHETGVEDNLLRARSIDAWAGIVRRSYELKAAAAGDAAGPASERGIEFRTSGSSGQPKRVRHVLSDLVAEVEEHAARFVGCTRIITTVSSIHIYGFLFGVLLPSVLSVPLLDGRGWSAARFRRELTPGTLVVSFPDFWRYLADSVPTVGGDVQGVSSTAPLPSETAQLLEAAGWSRIWEIFGSTETAGIGFRNSHAEPFSLLDLLERDGDRLRRRRDGSAVIPPDLLTWVDERRFVPNRRLDGAVQVGGVNVFPASVAERLRGFPGVADATVRLMANGEGGRLKAMVVPDRSLGPEERAALRDRISAWAFENLTATERPGSIVVAEQLPRNALGKLTDWKVEDYAV